MPAEIPVGDPENVSSNVSYLVKPEASFVTGQWWGAFERTGSRLNVIQGKLSRRTGVPSSKTKGLGRAVELNPGIEVGVAHELWRSLTSMDACVSRGLAETMSELTMGRGKAQ